MVDVILTPARAREIAEDWVAARNDRDLECILSHYAENVVFSSPTVVTRYGDPSGVLRGKTALREHFRRGLETFGANVRFTLVDVLAGINGYTVYYTRENTIMPPNRAVHRTRRKRRSGDFDVGLQ